VGTGQLFTQGFQNFWLNVFSKRIILCVWTLALLFKTALLRWKCHKRSQSYDREIQMYNSSAVKYYNETSSLVCFENKIIVFCFENFTSLLTTTLALYIVINSEVVCTYDPGSDFSAEFSASTI
jgi:hypothetical protein